MAHEDDKPTLAGLRRNASRKSSVTRRGGRAPELPSLFDYSPEPAIKRAEQASQEPEVTAADVVAELSRGLAAETVTIHEERRTRVVAAVAAVAPRREAKVWSVGDLVRHVRGIIESNFSSVTVDGEISNWRPAGSGHCYFTLKDGSGQLSAVMFRKQASLLRFRPKDGDAVRVRGQVSVYEERGQMQVLVESMEEIGQGALLAAVQRLKERLRAEGLFERHRPLPAFPKCIGVVTSLQGAALRDIVKVCRRRHAAVNLLIYPAAVQGPRCAAEVIAGINWFSNNPQHADVVLV
ncbi:MAG: exodeoxyribonuclease VII large subunit, partial [Bryocella sp.]